MAKENTEKELAVIYSDLDQDKLVLPNFQRGFVWDRSKQKSLLASTLVDLPVGSLLILQGNTDDFSKRKLCYPDDYEISGSFACDYVLDGQQRLSSLRSMFYDLFSESWEDTWKGIYGELRTRWFVRIHIHQNQPDDDYLDAFGYKDLNFVSLNHLTDSDIEDFIDYRPIHKTKDKEAHHPAYAPTADDGTRFTKAQIKNAKANKFAQDFLVPLWEVSLGTSGLHRKVLGKIAEARIAELKDKAEENSHDTNFYRKIFAPIDVSLDDIELTLDEQLDERGNISPTAFVTEWATLQAKWVERVAAELESLPDRKIAIIQLTRNEVNRAVAIFEAINRGGAPLSVYDLVVAKSAQEKKQKNLSARIIETISTPLQISDQINERFHNENKEKKYVWAPDALGVIEGNEPSKVLKEWFVNVLSILAYSETHKEKIQVTHIKKEKILTLKTAEVNNFSQRTIDAISRALAFLQFRCGVTSAKDTPYKLMVVVLAYVLDSDDVWKSKRSLDRIEYWYWSSLFGGAYSKAQNERCINDIELLTSFVNDSTSNPFARYAERVLDVTDYVTKNILLRKDDAIEKEPTTIKQALLQYYLSNNPVDFLKKTDTTSPETLSTWAISSKEQEVEVHHVIPLANKTKMNESTADLRKVPQFILNSALNLAYISKTANREISDETPAVYVKEIKNMATSTHFLPPDLTELEQLISTLDEKDSVYESILGVRYDLISNHLKNELNSLAL